MANLCQLLLLLAASFAHKIENKAACGARLLKLTREFFGQRSAAAATQEEGRR